MQYQNPALATDLVVFGYNEGVLSVLLLNRKEEPFAGQWTLPGAFLQLDETLQQACTRVLHTKLGLKKLFLEQLYTFDTLGRDPRGRVVSVAYYALINPKKFAVVAGTMANDVQWFPTTGLPKLGFDHKAIFSKALARLQSKILYFPLGFELLDELFTMGELHQLYECILGRAVDRRNFTRKILDAEYVINTGLKRDGVRNRQPELFRFNNKLEKENFSLSLP